MATPLMTQYQSLKEQAPGALLFFRLGDFYELFFNDAVIASKLLGVTLTTRDKNKPDPVPMAGVPYHAAEGYIERLLNAGHQVAIAEQTESAKPGRELVERKIVRILSPAIRLDSHDAEARYLAALVPCKKSPTSPPLRSSDKKLSPWAHLILIEPSTGNTFSAVIASVEEFIPQALHHPIRHWILPDAPGLETNINMDLLRARGGFMETWSDTSSSRNREEAAALRHFQAAEAHSLGLPSEVCIGLGLIIHNLEQSLPSAISQIQLPKSLIDSTSMQVSSTARAQLDIEAPRDQTSLFNWLNHSYTAMGSRKLRTWLLNPMTHLPDILARQEQVASLQEPYEQGSLNDLRLLYDMDRLMSRITSGWATPKDLFDLCTSTHTAYQVIRKLEAGPLSSPSLAHRLTTTLQCILPSIQWIEQHLPTLCVPPPHSSKDGGMFQLGTSPELDEMIRWETNSDEELLKMEEQERLQTGINNLKIRNNRVFGYYIEVSAMHIHKVPSHYIRKQTTSTGERYITEQLKEFEVRALTAGERRRRAEEERFHFLIANASEHYSNCKLLSEVIAELDALQCFSRLLTDPAYRFPKFSTNGALALERAKHPVLYAKMKSDFIPIDIHSAPGERLHLITGPNMGGKSTAMKTIALLALLAQIGSPVPAESALLPLFDSIHTRMGAHDDLYSGASTFMVEMLDLAKILRSGSNRSLVILDEIGRGTSTYDGLSVARAAAEHLLTQVGALTFFATHYHELTNLKDSRFVNWHVDVEERSNRTIRFGYRLTRGPALQSFGIHVAQCAGLPPSVVTRARELLESLERRRNHNEPDTAQLDLFMNVPLQPSAEFSGSEKKEIFPPDTEASHPQPHPAIARLKELIPDEMSPREALAQIFDLCSLASDEEANHKDKDGEPGLRSIPTETPAHSIGLANTPET